MNDGQIVMAIFGAAVIAFIGWIIWTAGTDPVDDESVINE